MHNDRPALVSVLWLSQNLNAQNLILLDATIKSATNAIFFSSEEWIPQTRYFDLKGKFSDVSSQFPTTLPSAQQFENEARQLGINNGSNIVVYDAKGIYSSARVWYNPTSQPFSRFRIYFVKSFIRSCI